MLNTINTIQRKEFQEMFTTGDIIAIVAILALVICFIVTLIKDKDK